MLTLNDYRFHLDTLTDELLKKSGSTIKKIDENIKLTHSLRLSNSLISQMDLQTNFLTKELEKYQFYLTELNSLMIRSEYLETQLNILEAHQALNDKRSSKGLPKLSDWKDDDLNLRTIEATLENLNLELRYLTKKLESRAPFSPRRSKHRFNYADDDTTATKSKPKQTVLSEPIRIPKTRSSQIELRPIRCSSRTEENHSTPKSSKSFNLLTKRKTHLPTPESSFNTTVYSSPPHDKDYSPVTSIEASPDIVKNIVTFDKSPVIVRDTIKFDESPLTFKYRKHKRSSSLPFTESGLLDELESSFTSDRKSYLRHFISHDTGLKVKTEERKEEECVKDSQFAHSPVSLDLDNFLIGSSATVKVESVTEVDCPPIIEEDETLEPEQGQETYPDVLPTFEHKLNRSNSCDSIFSTMVSRVPVYSKRDNKEQTLSWMKRFNNTQRPIVKESNATTFSVGTISQPSISIDTRKTLSHLVRQPQPTPSSAQAQRQNPSSVSNNSSNTFLGSSAFQQFFRKTPATISAQAQEVLPETAETSISVVPVQATIEETHLESNQWSTLLNKFRPQNYFPAQSLVTSEIGRPIPIKNSHAIIHNNQPELIKGSFSTLTIGPNGSKFVQHGESSSLAQSLVLSSRVSHTALKEALNNDMLF